MWTKYLWALSMLIVSEMPRFKLKSLKVLAQYVQIQSSHNFWMAISCFPQTLFLHCCKLESFAWMCGCLRKRPDVADIFLCYLWFSVIALLQSNNLNKMLCQSSSFFVLLWDLKLAKILRNVCKKLYTCAFYMKTFLATSGLFSQAPTYICCPSSW